MVEIFNRLTINNLTSLLVNDYLLTFLSLQTVNDFEIQPKVVQTVSLAKTLPTINQLQKHQKIVEPKSSGTINLPSGSIILQGSPTQTVQFVPTTITSNNSTYKATVLHVNSGPPPLKPLNPSKTLPNAPHIPKDTLR